MRHYLFILLFLLCLTSNAQHFKTGLKNIQYQSEFERQQFERFFVHNETNYLELLVASDPNGNISISTQLQEKLDNTLGESYAAKLSKKSASKKVKSIYETIHREFLDKYVAENFFASVVKTGSYNCVTATALYALAFEKLGIPYSIQEKPTHVYALAYPGSEQIVVESTDPIGGFLAFNERHKSAFIQQMVEAKLIGSKERNTKSLQSLFDEYYFQGADVNILQLVGIQYMNQGIYDLNTGNTLQAINDFEKAYLFYPSEKIGYTLLVAYLQYLANSHFTKPRDAVILARLDHYRKFGISTEIILNEFQRAMNMLLIENSNTEGAESFYQKVMENTSNDSLNSELSHRYYYERARILYNRGDYSKSLSFSSEAVALKPKNQNTESLFISAISNKHRSTSNFKTIQKELEGYAQKYEQLMNNKLFAGMLANTYLMLFAQSYDFRRIKEGEQYHEMFKSLYEQDMNIDQNNVGRAYSIAAVYYFRLGNKKKALSFLNEGLAIAPGNYELQTRHRMIR
ncbi:MAG: hypothetical protein AAGG59_03955 [Bacteroidota bacterium]